MPTESHLPARAQYGGRAAHVIMAQVADVCLWVQEVRPLPIEPNERAQHQWWACSGAVRIDPTGGLRHAFRHGAGEFPIASRGPLLLTALANSHTKKPRP